MSYLLFTSPITLQIKAMEFWPEGWISSPDEVKCYISKTGCKYAVTSLC